MDAIQRTTYEALQVTAKFLQCQIPTTPKIGIICGSGLGSLVEAITDQIIVSYKSIPNFPTCSVAGHINRLVFGNLSGLYTVCMQGRFHYYEGHPLSKCVIPIRVMKLLGVTHLIITNAAGAVNEKYQVGDIMLIKDHINLMAFAGSSPLIGPNDERFGPRFLAMNKAYDKNLLEVALRVARNSGLGDKTHVGVYCCVGGPTYETVAELKYLDMLGVDAVGMSTVHEVVAAKHCGLTVFAFSLITNEGIQSYECEDEPSHDIVMESGKLSEDILKKYLIEIVAQIKDVSS